MSVRRVVTGIDADGTSRFVNDGTPPCVLANPALSGMEVTYVWATDTKPHMPNAGDDETRLDQEFFPGRDGSRFLVITYPPGFGAGPPGSEVATEDMETPVSFDQLLMHATTTIDYGIVLQGELTLVLDSGEEVTLRPMDTVVQNGTVHGWRNSSNETAIVAFVVIGADPA